MSLNLPIIVGKKYKTCNDNREITIQGRFKSLFVGIDMVSGEEFSFYNTGESTSIHCGWLQERGEKCILKK